MSKSEARQLSDKKAWQLQLSRETADAAVSSYAPKLAESPSITVIYERLQDAEATLVPGKDYLVGSAKVDDEVLVLHGLNRVLLTAEHATIQTRREKAKEADMGTGALAEVVAQDTNSTAMIAIGRQTSDPNYDTDHPFKTAMCKVLELSENRAHLSLHMLNRGRASKPEDTHGYSILLGIGNNPSDATLALKDSIVTIASDLDLRVGVNQPHINFDKNHRLVRDDEGNLKTVTFAAAGPNTTRSFSEALAGHLGKYSEFAAIQVEINEVLLKLQNDEVDFPTQLDRELGAYLGYLFVRMAVESVAQL